MLQQSYNIKKKKLKVRKAWGKFPENSQKIHNFYFGPKVLEPPRSIKAQPVWVLDKKVGQWTVARATHVHP